MQQKSTDVGFIWPTTTRVSFNSAHFSPISLFHRPFVPCFLHPFVGQNKRLLYFGLHIHFVPVTNELCYMLTFCTQRVGRDREQEKNLCGFDGSVSTFLKETWPASQSLCAPFLWVLCLLQGWRICFSCFTERCLSACALQQCGRDSSVEVLSSVKPREIRATMSLLFPVRTATANLKKAIEIWLA